MVPLFVNKSFVSHAGQRLEWKIDCDALTGEDLGTLAELIGTKYRFGKVVGVPRGGLRFAEKLQQYISTDSTDVLIVDDVLTTGTSMEEIRQEYLESRSFGVVIFSRGVCPSWVLPIFQLNYLLCGVSR
jgi:hypothetical protein